MASAGAARRTSTRQSPPGSVAIKRQRQCRVRHHRNIPRPSFTTHRSSTATIIRTTSIDPSHAPPAPSLRPPFNAHSIVSTICRPLVSIDILGGGGETSLSKRVHRRKKAHVTLRPVRGPVHHLPHPPQQPLPHHSSTSSSSHPFSASLAPRSFTNRDDAAPYLVVAPIPASNPPLPPPPAWRVGSLKRPHTLLLPDVRALLSLMKQPRTPSGNGPAASWSSPGEVLQLGQAWGPSWGLL